MMDKKLSMPDRPNVIWILADQLRAQALSCNGETNITTPNLDTMALRGVNFQNAVSGFPLCCPFRGSMLTGLYPHHCTPGHDMGLPPEKNTIANVFRENGYHTAYFGKWHLDKEGIEDDISNKRAVFHVVPPERRGGFHEWVGYQNNNEGWDCYVHGGEGDSAFMKRLPGYETDALTDILIDFLEKPHDDPFFAVLSVFPPHNPYVAPEKYMEGINPNKLELRRNVPDIPWVQKQARRELQGYYADVKNIDYNVGRVMSALDRLGLADDTYVIFFSDHGDMHGSHGQFRKTTPMEEAVRIPFIISTGRGDLYSVKQSLLYGKNGAEICKAPINHVDIAPTTLGLCGIETPEWMEGYDYSGAITGKPMKKPMPDSAYIQCNIPTMHYDSVGKAWRGIITADGWKYVAIENCEWLLYNLNDDPYEQMNMAYITNYRHILRRMNDRLGRWISETGDEFPLPVIADDGPDQDQDFDCFGNGHYQDLYY